MTTIHQLKWETWELIAEFLLGKRNLKTGKKTGKPGRPGMTEEEGASTHQPMMQPSWCQSLWRFCVACFLKQQTRHIRDRAIEIAAKIKRISEKTLIYYLRRSQRISPSAVNTELRIGVVVKGAFSWPP